MVEKSCCFFCRSPALARHRGAFEYHEPARLRGTERPGGRELIGDSCAHRAVQPSEHPSRHLQNQRFVGVPTALFFTIGATRVILRRWLGDENHLQALQALTSSLSSSSGRGPMEGRKDFCLPPAAGGGPSHWNEMVAILFAPAGLGLVEKKWLTTSCNKLVVVEHGFSTRRAAEAASRLGSLDTCMSSWLDDVVFVTALFELIRFFGSAAA